MKTFSQSAPNPKIIQKRRGIRMNSRVPVAVEWLEPGGGTRRELAFTRIISPYGCLVVLPQRLTIEQEIRLVNLATGQANLGMVVWNGNEQAEGWELGIELAEPPMDYWGFEL